MITRFITSVHASFCPLIAKHRHARVFLAQLPSNARAEGMKISSKLLPAGTDEPSELVLTFRDGREMRLDPGKIGLKGVQKEVDQHSRLLKRQEDLGSS